MRVEKVEMKLTDNEWAMLFESLEYTKKAIREYSDYPSYEFKVQRMKEVKDLIQKLRQVRKGVERERVVRVIEKMEYSGA